MWEFEGGSAQVPGFIFPCNKPSHPIAKAGLVSNAKGHESEDYEIHASVIRYLIIDEDLDRIIDNSVASIS